MGPRQRAAGTQRAIDYDSTVRSVASPSAPQTSSSSASRERMRPGVRRSARRSPNSSRVSASHWPPKQMRWPSASSSNRPGRRRGHGRRRQRGAPQQRADAGHQLARAERLGEVVVGAQLEADDAVQLLGARRQHQDRQRAQRDRAGLAPFAAEVQAAAVGQAHVQDRQRRRGRRHAGARRTDQQHMVDGEALALQREGDGAGDGRIVFEEQDARTQLAETPDSAGNSLSRPSDNSSTAIAARISPISRVITLMPVRPSSLAMRPAAENAAKVATPMTTP